MAKNQPIGYFVGGGKGGFVGGIGLVGSGMTKSKLWRSCQKGDISPECRKDYQPMAITPVHTLQENWEDYVASGRTQRIHKTWVEHRGTLWTYQEALKEAEKIAEEDRNSEEDGIMEVTTPLGEQGTRERHNTLEERSVHQEDNGTEKPQIRKERNSTEKSKDNNEEDQGEERGEQGESGIVKEERETGRHPDKVARGRPGKSGRNTTTTLTKNKRTPKTPRRYAAADSGDQAEDSTDDETEPCDNCLLPGKAHRTTPREKLVWLRCDTCDKWVIKGCKKEPQARKKGKWDCKRCKEQDMDSLWEK